MSNVDEPTTRYRDIAGEWWDGWKEIASGWELWFALILFQTVTVIAAYTNPDIVPAPVWVDAVIYIGSIVFFIDGWFD